MSFSFTSHSTTIISSQWHCHLWRTVFHFLSMLFAIRYISVAANQLRDHRKMKLCASTLAFESIHKPFCCSSCALLYSSGRMHYALSVKMVVDWFTNTRLLRKSWGVSKLSYTYTWFKINNAGHFTSLGVLKVPQWYLDLGPFLKINKPLVFLNCKKR